MSRIVLLHATPVAIQPIQTAFAELWPEAEIVNLLDDSLSIDRAKEGDSVSEEMIERFSKLGHYAHDIGADGILVTCSAFGPAISRLINELPIPVLKPNEAMFKEALRHGGSIGMLATFGPSVPTMTEEFEQYAGQLQSSARLETLLVDDAMDSLRSGDAERHNELIATRADELTGCDVILLAHFSTSRALDEVSRNVDVPVLTAPHSAVNEMRKLLQQ